MTHGPTGWRRVVCHALAATIAITLIMPISIMLFDRRQVVEISNLSITPKVLIPGQHATLNWRAVVFRPACDGEVRRQLIDSEGIVHNYQIQGTVFRPGGEAQPSAVSFIVPPTAAPGPAIHRTYVTRWCNPLQEHIWPMRDPVRDVRVVIADVPTRRNMR